MENPVNLMYVRSQHRFYLSMVSALFVHHFQNHQKKIPASVPQSHATPNRGFSKMEAVLFAICIQGAPLTRNSAKPMYAIQDRSWSRMGRAINVVTSLELKVMEEDVKRMFACPHRGSCLMAHVLIVHHMRELRVLEVGYVGLILAFTGKSWWLMVPVNYVPVFIYSVKMEKGAINRVVGIEKNGYTVDNVSSARTIQERYGEMARTQSNNVPAIPAQPGRESNWTESAPLALFTQKLNKTVKYANKTSAMEDKRL